MEELGLTRLPWYISVTASLVLETGAVTVYPGLGKCINIFHRECLGENSPRMVVDFGS